MSYVIAAPEALVAAATDLATLGSTIGAANAAAAGSTTALLTAGADEVSAAIAAYSECTARPIRHSVRGRANSGVTTVAAVAEQPGDTARPTVATGRCAVLAGAE